MKKRGCNKLFHEGKEKFAYKYFGAHFSEKDGVSGVCFRLWAPNAFSVSVVGDFNDWNPLKDVMQRSAEDESVWELFVADVPEYAAYKYSIITKEKKRLMKADPYAVHSETRPQTASKVYNLDGYIWRDGNWKNFRKENNFFKSAVNIYELHLGSWRRHPDGNFYSYRDAARELVPYVKQMGYTHIELLPISEHPLDASWGYQVTGYFSVTSRFGTPHDFMYFVDECHRNGIGVILDWVAAHFPRDEQGLYRFDGKALYEYGDEIKGEHKEWGTMVFDYGRNEVRSFLISNAIFWCDVFHIDGLRVDAVASMLYLDYGRENGSWCANIYGGNGNLEAAEFLRLLNSSVLAEFPDIMMIAEESTSWPNITKPPYAGGLGFHFKWNMGWMNDTLRYFSTDPIFRKHHHDALTFSLTYAFSENYVLPFSHDEVVHGKCSLINKHPGNYEEKFAGLRAMLGYIMAHPGKKLSFMGNEFAQFIEWDYKKALDWELLSFEMHRKFRDYARELNMLYLERAELWEIDDGWDGFEWVTVDDAEENTAVFMRKSSDGSELYSVFNFSPVKRADYRFGVNDSGRYEVLLCSDDEKFGGFGVLSSRYLRAERREYKGFKRSVKLTLPPMCAIFIKKRGRKNYEKD